jgi:hypothetical protein
MQNISSKRKFGNEVFTLRKQDGYITKKESVEKLASIIRSSGKKARVVHFEKGYLIYERSK